MPAIASMPDTFATPAPATVANDLLNSAMKKTSHCSRDTILVTLHMLQFPQEGFLDCFRREIYVRFVGVIRFRLVPTKRTSEESRAIEMNEKAKNEALMGCRACNS